MFTIDEIRIEGEEDGFHLVLYLDDEAVPGRTEIVRYRIGLPDTFKYEVDRTIGAWLAEGEAARVEYVTMRDDRGSEGYAPDDPKHADYHDNMSAIHDNREGK